MFGHRLSLLFTLFVLDCTSVLAKPFDKRWDDLVTKHSWSSIPEGWEFHDIPSKEHEIQIRIGLKQQNPQALIDTLLAVSDPAHAKYGQHLSKEEVDELVKPHPESVEMVDEWLQHNGVNVSCMTKSTSGEWISLTIPVAHAEHLLDTSYGVYRHSLSQETVLRTLSYSIPQVLHDHIDVIVPTTHFGSGKGRKSPLQPVLPLGTPLSQSAKRAATVPSSCSSLSVTPQCIRDLYNTTNYVPTRSEKNRIGVVGYENNFASFADLQTFFKNYRPDATPTNFTVISVNGGGNDQSSPGIEANMDLQYAAVISYPIETIYFSVNGTPPFLSNSNPLNSHDPFLDFLDFVLDMDSADLPSVFTESYSNDEDSVPQDYAEKVCNGFAKLGARGVSIINSSGDFGVGGGFCWNFRPKFPCSCPWVTAVGGTTGFGPEGAAVISGGGFSNYFSQPSYQSDAVSGFLSKLGSTYNGRYNKTGRGYPDISAQSLLTPVIVKGFTLPAGGTSVSAPTVAAVIALLNDHRLSQGKPVLGFLNPWLYSTGKDGMTDITGGSNPGCLSTGFSAVEGWDPATGFGTPDFGKLVDLV